jgi:thiol-disulfide isomerase/thioredoxin
MARMKRVAALALLALVPALLAGCGRDQPASALVGTEEVGVDDRGDSLSIVGSTLDGAPFDLADLRGKVVVLNSWASWCPPCEAEMPAFVNLSETTDPNDVVVVGLNVSDELAAAQAFIEEMGMTFPSVSDPDGALLASIPGVPPKSLPSTVILDRDGRIATRIIGATDPVSLARDLGAVLGAPVAGEG